VFIWNRKRREYDHDTQKWVVVLIPRSEWIIKFSPELAIVPLATWKAARKKLMAARRKNPATGRKPSRNEKSATTLFSGTLFCGPCGHELKLVRSAGKYKVMGCLNGPMGKHGCKLSTSKSTRIIEESLLGYLRDRLLTEEHVESLVGKANAYLVEEAAKPRVNTAPIKTKIREKEVAIKKLVGRIEKTDMEAVIRSYEKRIAEYQKEVDELKRQLREAETRNTPPPTRRGNSEVLADGPAGPPESGDSDRRRGNPQFDGADYHHAGEGAGQVTGRDLDCVVQPGFPWVLEEVCQGEGLSRIRDFGVPDNFISRETKMAAPVSFSRWLCGDSPVK
jgi:hypothetical protein